MAEKSIIRSIRISPKMQELIEAQAGSSFTEKWENLVTRCCFEEDAAKQRLAVIQKEIAAAYDRLWRLSRATENLRMLENDLNSAKRDFTIVARRAASIAAAFEAEDGEL